MCRLIRLESKSEPLAGPIEPAHVAEEEPAPPLGARPETRNPKPEKTRNQKPETRTVSNGGLHARATSTSHPAPSAPFACRVRDESLSADGWHPPLADAGGNARERGGGESSPRPPREARPAAPYPRVDGGGRISRSATAAAVREIDEVVEQIVAWP